MNSVTRSQFTNFNLSYWREHGGQDLPYYDELPAQRKQRVYIDAAIFTRWETWKVQADIAREAAVMGQNPMTQGWVKRGDALPLSADPPFMAEYNRFTQEYRLWINALCPSESEFKRAVAACAERARRRLDIITRYGYLAVMPEAQEDLQEPLYSTIRPPQTAAERSVQQMYEDLTQGRG